MKSTREQVETGRQGGLVRFLKKIVSKISGLFEPEEVEVTFKTDGKKVSYTYTKVNHKQVA